MIFVYLKHYYNRASALFSTFTNFIFIGLIFYCLFGIIQFRFMVDPLFELTILEKDPLLFSLEYDFRKNFNYNAKQIYFSVYSKSKNSKNEKKIVLIDKLITRKDKFFDKLELKPNHELFKNYNIDDNDLVFFYEVVPYAGIIQVKE